LDARSGRAFGVRGDGGKCFPFTTFRRLIGPITLAVY
jgi:hypothetical protein